MEISGIGSRSTYLYDTRTKQLSTKDGQSDAFTDYFNGNASDESLQELNGFDSNRKRDIKNMMKLFECGALSAGEDSDVYEITNDIVDGGSTDYYVNGKKVFTAYNAVDYTYDEVKSFKLPSEDGNTSVIPDSIYTKARKRYEEMLSQSLSTWKKGEVSGTKTAFDADTYDYLDPNGITVYAKDGTALAEKALTDQRYTDNKTGISWFVGEDGRPYMIGADVEKFREMCRKNGEIPLKKFVEMTGVI